MKCSVSLLYNSFLHFELKFRVAASCLCEAIVAQDAYLTYCIYAGLKYLRSNTFGFLFTREV